MTKFEWAPKHPPAGWTNNNQYINNNNNLWIKEKTNAEKNYLGLESWVVHTLLRVFYPFAQSAIRIHKTFHVCTVKNIFM